MRWLEPDLGEMERQTLDYLLDAFARAIGTTTAEAIIRDHVLRLSYTAHDLKRFAEDLGYQGAPFPWDAEERLHLRARLDALFFLLYGLDRDAADYILGTFPIVREEEDKHFDGRFRPRAPSSAPRRRSARATPTAGSRPIIPTPVRAARATPAARLRQRLAAQAFRGGFAMPRARLVEADFAP
jgi:hypothetical protein